MSDELTNEMVRDDIPRFAYEEAEAILDAFAQTQDDVYRRAWQKAKFMATAYAYADYFDDYPGEQPVYPALALARGWEELQIAFTGRGEASMTGVVWQLWDVLPGKKAEKKFVQAVRRAWEAAEKATPSHALRLYEKEDRLARPFRFMDEVWMPNVLMPNEAVRCRVFWQKDPDVDIRDQDDVAEHLEWVEFSELEPSERSTWMPWADAAEA
jgi:hypothetical protein